MSDLVVRVEKIREILPHSNADRLELATVQGWQVVIIKGSMQVGDAVFYVPPDCMLPEDTAKTFGVEKYLGKGGRVKKIRLRGEVSLGLCVPVGVTSKSFKVGGDAAKYWGITKYEPPKRTGGAFQGGRTRAEIDGFSKYTEIQNLRHLRNKIAEGTPVFVQEKLHGTNSRVGMVKGLLLSGSRNLRRGNLYTTFGASVKEAWLVYTSNRKPKILRRELKRLWGLFTGKLGGDKVEGLYTMPWSVPGVELLVRHFSKINDGANVVVYGEIYGGGVQGSKMNYGAGEEKQYAVFDIRVGGRYLSPSHMLRACELFGVSVAPVVNRGTPYNFEHIKDLSSGKSLVPGAGHIREGVVVRTLEPGTSEDRIILKLVSDEYLVGDYEDFLEE